MLERGAGSDSKLKSELHRADKSVYLVTGIMCDYSYVDHDMQRERGLFWSTDRHRFYRRICSRYGEHAWQRRDVLTINCHPMKRSAG